MITVPELIWSGGVGALAGAVVALVTAWLNNRAQNSRQIQQLQHDVEQRTRQLQHDVAQRKTQFEHDDQQRRTDREMGLRREIYLEAVAAIGKMQDYIASYARQDLPEGEKLAKIQGATSALNKVQIVGTNATIEAFWGAQRAFAQSSFSLGRIKLETIRKTIDIEQAQRGMRLLEEKRTGILEFARSLGPTAHPERVEEIRASLKAIESDLEVMSDSLDKAQDQLFELQMALAKESTKSNLAVSVAFSEVALAVRKEFILDLEIEAYRAFVDKQQAETAKEFDAFIAHVKERANAEDEPHNPGHQADG